MSVIQRAHKSQCVSQTSASVPLIATNVSLAIVTCVFVSRVTVVEGYRRTYNLIMFYSVMLQYLLTPFLGSRN